jgi:MFS transporter, DHA3 family, tetracycline resistance protein
VPGRLDPRSTWLLLRVGSNLASSMVFTISGVYFVSSVHMTPLQLVLVGTVMELTIFVFEIPTGVVADVYSHRLSIVIGNVVMGLGLVLAGAVPQVWAVLAGWSVWGFGYTFTSGATEAWLADEVGSGNVRPPYLRGAQVGRIAALAGIGASVVLALRSLWLPVVAGGVLLVLLGVATAVLMPETGFRPATREEVGALRHAGRAARGGVSIVRRTPLLLLVLGISGCWGAWSESGDRLWEAQFIRNVGVPSFAGLSFVVWFGVLDAAMLLIAIFVARPLNRRLERLAHRGVVRVLLVLDVVLVLASLAFGIAVGFAAAAVAILVQRTARSIAGPLFDSWINESIEDSPARATVLSIVSQSDAVGQWTGGPAIGGIGNVYGIRAALVTGSFLLTPALGLYARALRHGGAEPELEQLAETVETGA